jgi:Predicted membrane protein
MSAPEINNISGSADSHAATPGHRWPYMVTALLSLVGLADAIYLTVKHLTGQSVQCTISTGCDAVLGSPYASIGGYPLAALGALAYFTVFSLATLALYGYRMARTLLIIVVGLMTLMTLRLIYLQAFVLNQYCEFCLLSAAITFSLAVLMVFLLIKK